MLNHVASQLSNRLERVRIRLRQRMNSPAILVLLGVMLVGCSSSRPSARGWGGRVVGADTVLADDMTETVSNTSSKADSRAEPIESPESLVLAREQLLNILITELDEWIGTPHVWGGTSLSGVDCSGLVQTVFRDALNVRLPRTTSELEKEGHSIRRSELRTGDLVFFRPNGTGRHVGIYLENRQFVHSSGSRGVMRSSLDDSYWDRYYHKSRRVFKSTEELINAVLYARRMLAIRNEIQRSRDQIDSPSG